MKLEQRNGSLEFNENEVVVTLDLRQSKRFYNESFDTESIDADLFLRSITDDAPILFNHKTEQIVSDDYEVSAKDGVVTVKVQLDPRNMWANTILSLREKSQKRLGCSFGFRCLADEIRNKHRIVKELIVSEISILSCESAYPSSVRCLENNEIRELTMEELQEMIDKSVAKALQPKENEQKIEEKIEEKVAEKPQEEPKKEEKPVEKVDEKPVQETKIKVDTDEIKAVFDGFLTEFKAILPKNEPKIEEKTDEKVVEEPQKVDEKPQEKSQEKPIIDDEKVKKDIESYKKMLEEMEE